MVLLTPMSMSQSTRLRLAIIILYLASERTYNRRCLGSMIFLSHSTTAANPLRCAPDCLSRQSARRSGHRWQRISSMPSFCSKSHTVPPDPSSSAMLSAIFCTAVLTSSLSANVILSARLCAVIRLKGTGTGPAPALAII